MKSRDLAPFHHIARILSVESHDSIVFPIIVRPMPTMVIPHFGVNIGHGPSGGGRVCVGSQAASPAPAGGPGCAARRIQPARRHNARTPLVHRRPPSNPIRHRRARATQRTQPRCALVWPSHFVRWVACEVALAAGCKNLAVRPRQGWSVGCWYGCVSESHAQCECVGVAVCWPVQCLCESVSLQLGAH